MRIASWHKKLVASAHRVMSAVTSPDFTSSIADVPCPHRGDAKLSDHHGVVVDLTRRPR